MLMPVTRLFTPPTVRFVEVSTGYGRELSLKRAIRFPG